MRTFALRRRSAPGAARGAVNLTLTHQSPSAAAIGQHVTEGNRVMYGVRYLSVLDLWRWRTVHSCKTHIYHPSMRQMRSVYSRKINPSQKTVIRSHTGFLPSQPLSLQTRTFDPISSYLTRARKKNRWMNV